MGISKKMKEWKEYYKKKIKENPSVSICDLLLKIGFSSSKGEAKRMLIKIYSLK